VSRVLFFTEGFWPYIGGVGVLAARLLPALRERGWEPSVVTPHDYLSLPNEDRFEGIPVLRLPLLEALRARDPARLLAIRRAVAEHKRRFAPDLVHVNAVGLHAWLHLRTAEVRPAPTLVTVHQDLREAAAAPDGVQGRTLRAADRVVCCSRALLDDVRKRLPELAGRSTVVPNGLARGGAPTERRPPAAPRLLCVGRLAAPKGFDLALRALPAIAARFPDATLTLAGDGPERSALEALAERLGVAGRVAFRGWVAPERVPELMAEASLLLLPSRREGLPLVALEAGLAELPLVGTRVGGTQEVVAHDETGLLVEAGDASGLARAALRLLEQPELASAMGRAARRRVASRFGFAAHVEAYDRLYRELVGRRPVEAPAPQRVFEARRADA
jgi:glycosyltransferase involved in cell wall biosynthesis